MEFPWVLYVEKKDIYLSMIQVIIKSVPKGEIQREKSLQCWGLLH